MTQLVLKLSDASSYLKKAASFWFIIILIGQIIFAFYILGLYGVNGIAGDFERWNSNTPHGYVEGDWAGNIFFATHILFAAIISIGGPLQLITELRHRFPKLHRTSGRIYIYAAFLISLAGFYLVWVKGSVGGLTGAIFISINGLLIFICAYYAILKAKNKAFAAHRKWAIRLFLAMSGVWFFRVGLMLWLTIFRAPVGFDPEGFQGPTLTVLYICCYICPVFFAELYFRAKESPSARFKIGTAFFIFLLSTGITIGTFSATMGMWLPHLR